MSKSIKPKANIYIDSTGIVHGRELLSDVLNSKFNTCGNIGRSQNWNNLSKSGLYNVNLWTGSGGSNYPEERFTGFAIILTYYQLCFDLANQKIRSRRLEGTEWTSWVTWS